jgi:hypothetical protein
MARLAGASLNIARLKHKNEFQIVTLLCWPRALPDTLLPQVHDASVAFADTLHKFLRVSL